MSFNSLQSRTRHKLTTESHQSALPPLEKGIFFTFVSFVCLSVKPIFMKLGSWVRYGPKTNRLGLGLIRI